MKPKALPRSTPWNSGQRFASSLNLPSLLSCLVVLAFPSFAAAQRPSSNWVDDVVWRDRTDGTPSLVVERILPGSPRQWDLRRGDRVVSFAGVIPESVAELRELSEQLDSIDASLAVLRGDRLVTLQRAGAPPSRNSGPEEIMPAEADRRFESIPASPASSSLDPNEPLAAAPSIPLGFQVTEFNPERLQGLDTPVVTGVLVQEVVGDSIAAKAGLKAGVILVAVDGRRVERPDEVQRWLIERAMVDSITLLGYEGRQLKRFRLDMTVEDGELESLPTTEGSDADSELPLSGPDSSPRPAATPKPSIMPPRTSNRPPVAGQGTLPAMRNTETEEIELPEALEAPLEDLESPSASEPAGERSLRRSDLLRRIERQRALLAEQQRLLDELLAELQRLDSGEAPEPELIDR